MKAVLTKVSASGRTYFHKGYVYEVETAGGGSALIAETGLLPGDAHLFVGEAEAQAEADWINSRGISDAKWTVAGVQP